jgi:hypothetical protein
MKAHLYTGLQIGIEQEQPFQSYTKKKKDTFSLSTDPSAALKFIGQYSRVTIGTSIIYHFFFCRTLKLFIKKCFNNN